MGDCDRMKHYISDYLENRLDPTTQKEFEEALKNSPQLRSMIHNISNITSRLKNLTYYKCSDDFSLKLRERIHTTSEKSPSRKYLVRYSFAASFIVVLIIIAFSVINLSNSPETAPDFQGNSNLRIQNTNPGSNPVSGNKVNTFVKDDEMNIRTKSAQDVISDSLHIEGQPADKPDDKPIKYVNEKK